MYDKPIVLKIDKTLGYQYFIDRDHPLAHRSTGRVYYHRHVASLMVGRWLKSHEHVHHKNDNRADNRRRNLVITTKAKHVSTHRGGPLPVVICPSCRDRFRQRYRTQVFCSVMCQHQALKKFDPEAAELEKLVQALPMTHVAKMFGVSDVAVKKRCKRLGIDPRRLKDRAPVS